MNEDIKIFIIQSLFDEDKKTGTNLYNNLSEFNDGIQLFLYENVYDKGMWYNTLEDINSKVENGDRVFIHLEIHGYENGTGIVFNNNEFFSYEIICEDFRRINRKIGCNLHVTLAVCHGLWMLANDSYFLEGMPFCSLIGSQEEIKEYDLEIRFNEFYQSLIRSYFDIDYAMEELQKANPKLPSSYKYVKPEIIFVNSWKAYLEQSENRDWQKENARKVQKEYGMTRQQRRMFERKFPKEKKKIAKELYEKFVKQFFMLEDFPANKQRFDIPEYTNLK